MWIEIFVADDDIAHTPCSVFRIYSYNMPDGMLLSIYLAHFFAGMKQLADIDIQL
jgi:hypothetical protein